jgi:hypothetical protein
VDVGCHGLRPSRTNLRVFYDGDRPSRTTSQDALSTTMSDLATITNTPTSMVTRHGFSCIQPSVTSPSLVLFVQEPALQLLLLDTHGTYTPPKPVFNVVPLGRHTCRFEARRNVSQLTVVFSSSIANPTSDTNL